MPSSPTRFGTLRGVTDRAPDPDLVRRLLRAKDRMDAASHEEWPVRKLARVSGVSEAHFARAFKHAFGVPPHRYLLTRRIERAAALPVTGLATSQLMQALVGESQVVTGRIPTEAHAEARRR